MLMLIRIFTLLGFAYEFILFSILILNSVLPAGSFPDLRIYSLIGIALAIYIMIIVFFFPDPEVP